MTPLFTPEERAKALRRKEDWGESGASFAIAQDRALTQSQSVDIETMRQTITLNHRNNVPKNQTEQQKSRGVTFPIAVLWQYGRGIIYGGPRVYHD